MSRPWLAAAFVASLIAFAGSYALAATGDPAPGAVRISHRLAIRHLGPPPASWHKVRLPGSAAVLAYPGDWQAIGGDPGTASAALRVRGRIIGYLNATPQGGTETAANWLRFRPDHNREEGAGQVVPRAGRRGLHFRSGSGSCLIDDYTAGRGVRYRELACIVDGSRATTVIVGSTTLGTWPRLAPEVREAVSDFTT